METTNPIAVLGGGNGAHCMAADLALAGYDVNLCELPAFRESFRILFVWIGDSHRRARTR